MYACGFRIYFTPLPGFFSPFPHGTGSLSVDDEYLALEDGPPIFRQDFTCPALLIAPLVPPHSFRIRGYHPLWPDFPDRSVYPASTTGLLRVRSSLLAESLLMSFPPATEIFQFAGFASPHYGFMWRYPKGVGCPIRISTDQSLLAAPHGFSQRATSFIASWCQGIHRMPFSRSRSSSQA